MPKQRKPEQPSLQPTARDATQRLLVAIRDLDAENPFVLAAAIDWIRTEWRGKPCAVQALATLDESMAFIAKRTEELRLEAIAMARETVVLSAVES